MAGLVKAQRRLMDPQQFVELTKMDLTHFYMLFMTAKLPVVRINKNVFIDLDDIRAKSLLPDYKPKNLFE